MDWDQYPPTVQAVAADIVDRWTYRWAGPFRLADARRANATGWGRPLPPLDDAALQAAYALAQDELAALRDRSHPW